MTAQPIDADVPNIQLSQGKREAVLLAVLLGLFLSALDQTVVGTALPRIVTDLHGNALYTWVVTAYLLTSTVTVPIYGKLSDVYGRKILLMVGIGIFLAGSWLCGVSQTMEQLIVFRGLQGLGAGALFPISLAIIGDLFTPRERGRYQGLFGAVFGLSFIVGPFIGGWITDNVSWRWVFYVNMPIGIASLIVIAIVLPNFRPAVATPLRNLDFLGIAVFTAGVVPLLIGLTNKGLTNSHGQLHAWTDPSVGGLIVLGLVLLAIFLFVESRAKEPIIPLDLFRNRTFSATNLATFMVSFGMFAAVIFLPRYYQAVRGISATESGYMIWPLLLGLIGSSVSAGILVSRIGRYKYLVTGAIVLFIIGSFLMTHLQADTPDVSLWFWMLLMGLGIGPSMSVFTVVIQSVAPRAKLGVATSTLTFLRQIGGTVGLAISGTIFSQQFAQELPGRLIAHGVPRALASRLSQGSTQNSGSNLTGVGITATLNHAVPPQLHAVIPRIVAGVDDAIALAIGQVFWLPVGAGVVALIAVLTLPDLTLRGRAGGQERPADTVTVGDASGSEDSGEQEAAG